MRQEMRRMVSMTRKAPTTVAGSGDSDVRALRDLLAALAEHQTQMHGALEQQLEAMRHADVEGMQKAGQRVTELSRQFELLDAQRHTVVARLAERGGRSRNAPLSELLPVCPAESRGELVELGNALRDRMLAVADASRVATLVCREMSVHFQSVFETITRAAMPTTGYQRNGAVESGTVQVLSALG